MKQILLLFIIATALTINCFAQKKTVPKKDESSGSQLVMTIEHNGEKTEIKYSQFITADGTASPEGAANGRFLLFYGASNPKDDKNFMFQGWIPKPEKGTFEIGGGASFNVMTSLFPNVPLFGAKSGTIEITAMPPKGGFVEGTFSGACENVKDDGTIEKYNISGSFKLKRML